MKKKKALESLNAQLEKIPFLKTIKEEDTKYQEWKAKTLAIVKSIFGEESSNFKETKKKLFPDFYVSSFDDSQKDYHAIYQRRLEGYSILIRGMITEISLLDNTELNASNDSIAIIKNICNHFHQVARQLRNRHNNRPTINIEDEYDVQDLIHSLLRLYFDDIRSEEWTPSYAGGASRMDFLLKKEKIVIEIKKTRKGLDAKEIGNQLIIDIGKYAVHPDCKTLVCFVYDPEGRVVNPVGIESDLSQGHNELKVITIITPQ